MMQLNDALIRNVVQEVLAAMSQPGAAAAVARERSSNAGGRFGVFAQVDEAVEAAAQAQAEFERRPIEDREKALTCIRRICRDQADELGRLEYEETKIGRLENKPEKLRVVADHIPGTEFLKTETFSGTNGIALVEYAPFGVIGAVTPVTHSLPTLASNAISMLAAGNSVVVNPHPSGAKIAVHGTRLFNQAIHQAISIDNLISIIQEPTLETAQAIFDHKAIRLICVTGGPAVGKAALRSPKRAIVAGPGNPPVVVDETADLDLAAKSIIAGASYDNNLLCISEKEVFAVDVIFDKLLEAMERHGAYRLNRDEIERLTKTAFRGTEGDALRVGLNKDLIGQDASVLAEAAGIRLKRITPLLYGETNESNPFVDHEQMMPFLPFVRVPHVDAAIALAKKYEHGYKHTSIIHSKNLDVITRMGRELDTTLFVVNGPCGAGLGNGGEGYLSYSIATPTGEGVTTPLTFTRQRRLTVANGGLRVI
jgi:aldehyde dehydrogenase